MAISSEIVVRRLVAEREAAIREIGEIEPRINELKKKIEWIDAALRDDQETREEQGRPGGWRRPVRTPLPPAPEPQTVVVHNLKTPEIAKRTLQHHADEWLGTTIIAINAVKLGLWPDHPPSYKSVMSSTLKRAVEGGAKWVRVAPGSGNNRLYRWAGENGELMEP